MPRPTPGRRLVTALPCLALGTAAVLSSCSRPASPEAEPGGPPPPEAAGTASTGRATEESEPGEGGDALSPLGAYLGYPVPGLDGADDTEIRRLYEDTVARCMGQQGFDYVAWVPEPGSVVLPVEEGLDPESRAFATKYGFGVSTQFFAQRDVGPGLVGYTGSHSRLNLDADPNNAIRDSLPPEEREAYDRAFLGADNPIFDDPADYDEEAEGVPLGWAAATHGCVGEAERAIDGEAFDLMGLFATEILDLSTRARTDARYLDHIRSVERCVDDAGFDFYVHEPQWAILAHFDELVGQVDRLAGGNPFAELTEVEMASLSQEEIDALYDAPRHLSEQARDRLAEVQDLETATATAVWDCGGSAGQRRRVIDGILVDLQDEFIEANRTELERFRR